MQTLCNVKECFIPVKVDLNSVVIKRTLPSTHFLPTPPFSSMHVYLVANKQNLQLIAEKETIEVSLFDFNAEFWFIFLH